MFEQLDDDDRVLTQTRPSSVLRPAPDAEGALTAILTRAFADDPILRWVFPDALVRARRSPAFFGWSLRRLQPQGMTWTDTHETGVAIWALPGRWHETSREALELVRSVALGVGRRSPLVVSGLAAIERRHPPEPHLYLAVLGVEPGYQGRGVGSTLIQPGLDHCDDHHLPAYLETGNERNLDFYARHGFKITGQVLLPKGPPVWLMWRDPR